MRTVTGHQGRDARLHLLTAIGVGVATAAVCSFLAPWQITAMVSLIAGAGAFLVWTWLTIWGMTGAQTKSHAVAEGPNAGSSDGVVILACLAALFVVGFVIFKAGHTGKSWDTAALVLGIFSVLAAWFLVHTIYTLRYARQYYAPETADQTPKDAAASPINFHQAGDPRYSDFAYLAFGVGAAFQVSDTDLRSNQIRRSVLGHSLVSFLFGAVIVGATINLIAGLSS